MTEIARLHDLQKIDTNLEKANRHLQQLKKVLEEPAVVQQARSTVDATAQELALWNNRQRDSELEAQSLGSRIRGSEQKLMGGTVRNPKELEDLQQSIEAMKRQVAGVDEKGVEALEKVETLSATLLRQKNSFESLEKQWAAKQEEYLADESRTKRIVLQLRAHRAKLVEALPVADTQLYEDLRKRRAGVAVATIVNGQCSACNVKVPVGVVSAARSETVPAICTSCGRILVPA